MKSTRVIAVFVGVLFLTATVTFATGSGLLRSFILSGNSDKTSLIIGVLLEIACGVSVVAIGVLMFPILKMFNYRLALGYVVFRLFECALIIGSGMYLLILFKPIRKHEMIIFLFTGLGGLIFSFLLYQSRLVPRVLSLLGAVGYALLSVGVLLDLLGFFNMNSNAGMLFYIPGGFFELVLPVWLFIKGFNVSKSAGEFTAAKIEE
jgi:hypothetical protein